MNKDTLYAGEVLENGKTLKSKDGRFWLVMQPDGNLVLYVYGYHGNRAPRWASDTVEGHGSSHKLLMHDEGYIVITADGAGPHGHGWYRPIRILPSSHALRPWGVRGSRLVVQDDGNIVIYAPDGDATWASNTVYAARDRDLIPPNTFVIDVEHGGIDPIHERVLVNNTNERVAVRDGQLYVDLDPNERAGIRETEHLALAVSKLAVDELGRLIPRDEDDEDDKTEAGHVHDDEDGIAKVGLPIPHNEREIYIERDSSGYSLA